VRATIKAKRVEVLEGRFTHYGDGYTLIIESEDGDYLSVQVPVSIAHGLLPPDRERAALRLSR
jgi:hypothetical protein